MKKILVAILMGCLLFGLAGCKNNNNELDINGINTERVAFDEMRLKTAQLRIAVFRVMTSDVLVKYSELKPSYSGARTNEEGKINVADLFDGPDSVVQNAVNEICNKMDLVNGQLEIYSELKDTCSVKMFKIDDNDWIIQVTSDKYEVDFYYDLEGLHDGIYE